MGAIVIHGVEIAESLIAQEAQNHPAASVAASRTAAAHALATKALLLRRAAELGLEAAPERDEDGREETNEAALVRAVLDVEIEISPPGEAECLRVYNALLPRFRSPALYEASHILIEPDAGPGPDDAEARARQLIAGLASGQDSFAALALAHSACPSGTSGGSLGQLRAGDLVREVEEALLTLAPGQVAAGPVRSQFGWHVLRLDRRVPARDLPFEAVVESIRLHLESRAWSAAATRYVIGLAEEVQGQGIVASLTEQGVRDGSACLGDLFGDNDAVGRLLPWLEAGDPQLYFLVLEEAADRAVGPLELIRACVAQFVGRADDEQWTQIVSAARDGKDPGHAALSAMLKSTLPKAGGHFCSRAARLLS